jgi:hypothetical protein
MFATFDKIDNTEDCFTHRHTSTDVKRHQTTVEIISLQDDSCIVSVARVATFQECTYLF